jgi:hypothetical protein
LRLEDLLPENLLLVSIAELTNDPMSALGALYADYLRERERQGMNILQVMKNRNMCATF